MRRFSAFVAIAAACSLFAACDKARTPTGPSTPPAAPPPAPVTVTAVSVLGATCTAELRALCNVTSIGGTLQMSATASKSNGSTEDVTSRAIWGSTNTAVATVTSGGLVTFRRPGQGGITAVYEGKMGGQTLNVNPPTWSRTGQGDNVFDMPMYISRVRVTGMFPGRSSNFIVWVGGRLLVNELLGTSWGTSTYDGTLVTAGGQVEIRNSSGVTWSFTEVR